MLPKQESHLGEKIVIRRGRVDSVDLFEVKEHELEMLEQGSPASLQLNFSIFLLSIAFSAILTLTTATVASPILETVYIVISVVGILLGVYLLISWWRTKTTIKKIITTIKNRIPPELVRTEIELSASVEISHPNNQMPAG
jgi:multisubunit Na+/H+ antiporter MnhE subunit